MKKTTLIALVITLLCCNLGNALASNIEVLPKSQISTNPNYAEARGSSLINKGSNENNRYVGEDGLAIVHANSSIKKVSSSSIKVSATTDCNIVADMISVTMRVQRWKDNQWKTYTSFTVTQYDASESNITRNVNVPSGYYYRVRVVHLAVTSHSSVSVTTITSGVNVS